MNVINKAMIYAQNCHQGQMYGMLPYYEGHLKKVHQIALRFADAAQIPAIDLNSVLAACYCHDVIEDCRQSYNDVLEALGDEMATEIVYALTTGKGKTRKERANWYYYSGIRFTPYASFVKLCDRIANVESSKKNNPRMFQVYKDENAHFIDHLYSKETEGLCNYLENLFV